MKNKPRVRPPRVHITYDVEADDSVLITELPFVVGVLADLSGHPEEPLPRLGQRRFVEIDRENFDQVFAAMGPRLALKIRESPGDDGSESAVELKFRKLEDFGPESVARQIGSQLSHRINEILHQPEFQRLEAAWRGLRYLLDYTETGVMLKLKVLNVSKDDLRKDLEKAAEFDQSQLFRMVYSDVYGVFGGTPYSALIGDYEFSRHPQDLSLLEKVAGVANAAHAPFLSAASPQLFNCDDFTELSGPQDLAKMFDTPEYAKWKSFRESEESRYVGLCMPHILMRLPYGPDTTPVEAFNFKEDVDGKDHGKYLWGNAAYALGARITDAFAKYGWCAAIRGVEGGGLVEGLPTHTFPTDDGDIAMKCPTEIAITDRRVKELCDLGFIPLVHCIGTDCAAFFAAPSVHKPEKYDNSEATAHATISAGLQCIFCVSRFAQYLMAIVHDRRAGAPLAHEDLAPFLNRWINSYVLLDDDASEEMKARYPLREARIILEEEETRPGLYRIVAFLRPHFQIDLKHAVRLVIGFAPWQPATRGVGSSTRAAD